jgi:hypothetical protein
MSLDVCQYLGEQLADRHTCALHCYRFPECPPLDGEDHEPPDTRQQLAVSGTRASSATLIVNAHA